MYILGWNNTHSNGSEAFQSLWMGEEERGDDSFLDLNDINQWICWAREEVGLETIGHRVCRVEWMKKLVAGSQEENMRGSRKVDDVA